MDTKVVDELYIKNDYNLANISHEIESKWGELLDSSEKQKFIYCRSLKAYFIQGTKSLYIVEDNTNSQSLVRWEKIVANSIGVKKLIPVNSRQMLDRVQKILMKNYDTWQSDVKVYRTASTISKSLLLSIFLLKKYKISGDKSFTKLFKEFREFFQKNESLIRDCFSVQFNEVVDENIIDLNNILSNFTINTYLDFCLKADMVRADLEPYELNSLIDPNQGLWDLWDLYEDEGTSVSLKDVDLPLIYARNPLADIRWDGNVAIDFGTRSTVVAYQEKTDITNLMRVGTGQLTKEVKNSHYENPTILECINLDKFLQDYYSKDGRPNTEWADLTSSYTAASDLFTANASEYTAFLQSLKQWAGDSRRSIQFKDRQGKHYLLPPYVELKEDSFDPIEIYAYYIGLAINTMRNGIYLDYTLSFPVTYEKKIRDRILESFSRGIKKSLPEVVLKDEDCMSYFRVECGASEPAAYALCALQTFKFDVDENGLMYGVFDFGGGTTDFDFGILKEATGKDLRRYDHVLTCFGSGGDKYLGGENLLELLAYEVFKKNKSILREKGISFIRPMGARRFAADEVLVSTSQSAEMNTRILMEELRAFWEKPEGYENTYSSGVLKINLYNRKDKVVQDIELSFDINELEKLLKDRIEKGVINFFEAMRLSFKNSDCRYIDTVYCLLAGNSSRSPYVKDIFEKYMTIFDSEIKDKKAVGKEKNKVSFVLCPPLGTPEADSYITQQIGTEYESTVLSPTGKTGVVYGLLEGRAGGRIKVVQNNYVNNSQEIRFPYYIGFNKRGKFHFISSPDTPYNEWIEFIDAGEIDSTLYYSNLPEASTQSLSIDKVSRKKIRIQKSYSDESVCIFYRILNPTMIEYAVGIKSDVEKGVFIEYPKEIQLD